MIKSPKPLVEVATTYDQGVRWALGPLRCLFLTLLAMVAFTQQAEAEVVRYALVIGNNLGNADEEALHFAREDATRVANVLEELGDVPIENLVLLHDTRVEEVVRVMKDLNERLLMLEEGDQDNESLLFVYYSGHADFDGLHLDNTLLSLEETKALLEVSAADMKVLVIDACHSGELTRVKGGVPTTPFPIEVEEKLAGEGFAIITSSAANEDSQESERLQGSFFTHHFVAGLLGAADRSQDNLVSLAEAYEYAYDETLRSTSRTAIVQHPTYSFEIKGRRDLTLTNINQDKRGYSKLILLDEGDYLLFEKGDKGKLVSELRVDNPVELSLPTGPYLIRFREESQVKELEIDLEDGVLREVDSDQMVSIPLAKLVRKGISEEAHVWSLLVAMSAQSAIVASEDPFLSLALGAQLDLALSTLQFRLRYGAGQRENENITIQEHLFGADAALMKPFDFGPFACGPGLRIGVEWFRQSFNKDDLPGKNQLLGHGGAFLDLIYSPTDSLSLYIEGGAEIYLFSLYNDPIEDGSLDYQLSPFATLGLSLSL